nr:thiol reductant ABC exporter subunit CydC [Kibdelosporangium sp. MJ126-NF4]CEL19901.1 Transport ATP-binding protein CydC [Kibdelosporangium sp. MJ126-NF4]CTQ97125.1 Transport ATP-binding protein CydC [Kibdelosporangium sp. MJ126-NF4]
MISHLLHGIVPRRLLYAASAAVAAELAAVALMGTAAWLIARAAQHPPMSAVAVAVVAVRALALGRGVLRYAERLLGHDVALSAVSRQRARVYEALVPRAPDGVAAFRDGDVLTRLVDDVDAVQDLVLRCVIPAAVAAGVTVAVTGFTATLSFPAAAVLAAGLGIAGILMPCMVFASAGRTNGEKDTRAALAAHTTDLMRGAADLAAFNATGQALATARELGAELVAHERRRAVTAGLATAAILLIQGVTVIAVILFVRHADLPTGTVLVVLALTAFDVITPLSGAATALRGARASARRLGALLDTPEPVPEPPHPATTDGHTLEVRGLRVPGRLDGPVSLRVVPGRMVAIVGPSGIGKSTLLAALMRFTDYEGSATIGGHELKSLRGDDVRALITGMTQDAHVFDASLRDNLLFARPDATGNDLDRVARQARLLDWIESLPDGWDTRAGAVGVSMSGGQRQRLLLARALLANPAVLLLDEPTEGLDHDTAEALMADLRSATRNRAVLLVTHSPVAHAIADEIHPLGGNRGH